MKFRGHRKKHFNAGIRCLTSTFPIILQATVFWFYASHDTVEQILSSNSSYTAKQFLVQSLKMTNQSACLLSVRLDSVPEEMTSFRYSYDLILQHKKSTFSVNNLNYFKRNKTGIKCILADVSGESRMLLPSIRIISTRSCSWVIVIVVTGRGADLSIH